MSITRNKLHNKIQLPNANRSRPPFSPPNSNNPSYLCQKNAEPKGFCHLFSIFCFSFFSYRAKCWACCHIIYLFIYIHLKIIEKSSRVFCVRKEYVGTWHSSAEICSLACFSLSLLGKGKKQSSALSWQRKPTHQNTFP